ncbi:DUF1292 domain-containing protein [Xylocopilactobacillus apicola]|uniref:UPF0473 protein XA3_12510 n=1 Tax=Xylocopilactobacillus apicola TaxID=2932184 RepID=A0AAU9DBC0_9LACO|nr:DUF1292 domain-containing protein [Xylocopilactobacillus apicola]BDR58810.1 UPF0473 protein [Xylocopilactobacillus apicola]
MTDDKNFQDLGANLPENDEDFRKIVLVDDKGNTYDYTVLFTFDSEDYDKSYVIIYPTSEDESEILNLEAYSYTLDPNGSGTFGDLKAVEDEKELDMVEEVLNTFWDENGNDEGDS